MFLNKWKGVFIFKVPGISGIINFIWIWHFQGPSYSVEMHLPHRWDITAHAATASELEQMDTHWSKYKLEMAVQSKLCHWTQMYGSKSGSTINS